MATRINKGTVYFVSIHKETERERDDNQSGYFEPPMGRYEENVFRQEISADEAIELMRLLVEMRSRNQYGKK